MPITSFYYWEKVYSTLEQITYHVPSETMLNVAMAQCPAIIRPEIDMVSGFSHDVGKHRTNLSTILE